MSRATWRIFLRASTAKPFWALFCNVGFPIWENGCHGLIFEVVAPFFSLRRHPNTSLRESVCLWRQPAGSKRRGEIRPSRPDTEYSVATVSHCQSRLNQLDARHQGRVQVALSDWLRQARASSRGKGRCNHTPSFVFPLVDSGVVFPGFFGSPLPPSPSPRSSPRAPGIEAMGKADGGGTPSVEPEPRLLLLRGLSRSCLFGSRQKSLPRRAADPVRLVVRRPCATGSSPAGASPPPVRSSPRDVS